MKNNLEYRILLCEISKKSPAIKENNFKSTFLGYDYRGGSYYSCVNNEVVSGRILEFTRIQFNRNGLIESEKEIIQFIQMRETLCSKYPITTFEKGDFIVYKLSEILEL